MMIVALLLRAWALEMKEMGLHPRVLADDLQVVATGEQHLDDFVAGFDATHKHLESMGATLTPQIGGLLNGGNGENLAEAALLEESWQND